MLGSLLANRRSQGFLRYWTRQRIDSGGEVCSLDPPKEEDVVVALKPFRKVAKRISKVKVKLENAVDDLVSADVFEVPEAVMEGKYLAETFREELFSWEPELEADRLYIIQCWLFFCALRDQDEEDVEILLLAC